MYTKKKIVGSTLAIAAAVAFSSMPIVSSAASSNQVFCYGVNSCRGKGECQTAKSTCKGVNSCRGNGAILMSKKDCLKKGGSFKSK